MMSFACTAVDVLVLVTLIVVLIVGVGLILQVEAMNVNAYEQDLETRDRAQGELTVSLKNEKEMQALHQAFAAATLHEIRFAHIVMYMQPCIWPRIFQDFYLTLVFAFDWPIRLHIFPPSRQKPLPKHHCGSRTPHEGCSGSRPAGAADRDQWSD
jgi:hypothetical protein